MQQSQESRVLSARRIPSKDGKTLGVCAFAYRPDQMRDSAIKRSYQLKKDGKPVTDDQGNNVWRDSVEIEIRGAGLITVHSAFIKRSAKGELYLNVPAGLDLPWSLSKALAEQAVDMLPAVEASAKGAA